MAHIVTIDETTEKCIVCNGPTQYKISDNIDYRLHYIEGAGQLCPDCFAKEEKKITSTPKKVHKATTTAKKAKTKAKSLTKKAKKK